MTIWKGCTATAEGRMVRSGGERPRVHSQSSVSACVVAEGAGDSRSPSEEDLEGSRVKRQWV